VLDFEVPIFSPGNRFTDDGEFVSPLLPGRFLVLISVRGK
jgi:hypothetical protein